MELEIGMYVRTINGKIWIIKSQQAISGHRKDIINASYDIIDLIEVGDYVNGVEIINIDDEWITMSDIQVPILKSIANGMIKSVITHEQMEQMAYKVGE